MLKLRIVMHLLNHHFPLLPPLLRLHNRVILTQKLIPIIQLLIQRVIQQLLRLLVLQGQDIHELQAVTVSIRVHVVLGVLQGVLHDVLARVHVRPRGVVVLRDEVLNIAPGFDKGCELASAIGVTCVNLYKFI